MPPIMSDAADTLWRESDTMGGHRPDGLTTPYSYASATARALSRAPGEFHLGNAVRGGAERRAPPARRRQLAAYGVDELPGGGQQAGGEQDLDRVADQEVLDAQVPRL